MDTSENDKGKTHYVLVPFHCGIRLRPVSVGILRDGVGGSYPYVGQSVEEVGRVAAILDGSPRGEYWVDVTPSAGSLHCGDIVEVVSTRRRASIASGPKQPIPECEAKGNTYGLEYLDRNKPSVDQLQDTDLRLVRCPHDVGDCCFVLERSIMGL